MIKPHNHPSICITGASGQVGKEATLYFSQKGWRVTALSHNELDITNAQEVSAVLKDLTPTYLLNAAAYTNVEKAEEQQEIAFAINTQGVKNLVEACNLTKTTLIHISTDYVFDGTKNTPYQEEDSPSPLNVYGVSKYEGEKIIEKFSSSYLILRTSWVYRFEGHNFLTTMQNLARKRTVLTVIDDQWGVPTSALQIVTYIDTLLTENKRGLFHGVARGETTWFQFAQEIFRLLKISIDLTPCSSQEYPQKAVRPHYSVLSLQKVSSYQSAIAPWQEALAYEISRIKDSL